MRMASSTTAERLGGVSMNTHSTPSRLAAATMPLTEFTADLSAVRWCRAIYAKSKRSLRVGIDQKMGFVAL